MGANAMIDLVSVMYLFFGLINFVMYQIENVVHADNKPPHQSLISSPYAVLFSLLFSPCPKISEAELTKTRNQKMKERKPSRRVKYVRNSQKGKSQHNFRFCKYVHTKYTRPKNASLWFFFAIQRGQLFEMNAQGRDGMRGRGGLFLFFRLCLPWLHVRYPDKIIRSPD